MPDPSARDHLPTPSDALRAAQHRADAVERQRTIEAMSEEPRWRHWLSPTTPPPAAGPAPSATLHRPADGAPRLTCARCGASWSMPGGFAEVEHLPIVKAWAETTYSAHAAACQPSCLRSALPRSAALWSVMPVRHRVASVMLILAPFAAVGALGLIAYRLLRHHG